jgi:hypothetical protein
MGVTALKRNPIDWKVYKIKAGRIITGLRCNSSRQKVYHELGWETLENRRNKHKLILFYKILNGLTWWCTLGTEDLLAVAKPGCHIIAE